MAVLAMAMLGACGVGYRDGTGPAHGSAARIAKRAGDGQTATVGTAVSTPPSVMITDAAGRPVPLTAVTFSVTAGGGTVVPTAPVPSTSSGVASATTWTLGPATGANTLTATAAGLAGSPVTFTATGTSGTIIKVGNGSQLVFVPDQVTVPVGSSVTWEWDGGAIQHNVSTSNGSPTVPGTPSATRATPSAFGPVTFNAAGTYRFYCSVHAGPNDTSGMVGTITVQ